MCSLHVGPGPQDLSVKNVAQYSCKGVDQATYQKTTVCTGWLTCT